MQVSELLDKFKSDHSHLVEMGMRVMGLGLAEYVATPIKGEELEVFISPVYAPEDNVPMTGVIQVHTPIIFDYTELPVSWEVEHSGSYSINYAVDGETWGNIPSTVERSTVEVPKEFQGMDELHWDEGMAPWRYEALVDRCVDEIRRIFGKPELSKDELLNALAFGDFKKHQRECEEMKLKRLGIR